VLVAELQVAVNEVADRLDLCPAGRDVAELPPGDIGQQIGFAITAAEQKTQRLVRKFLNRVLACVPVDLVRRTGIGDHRVRKDTDRAGRRHHTGAAVAEIVQIPGRANRRVEHQPVRDTKVGPATVVHGEHQHHRRRQRVIVAEFKANS